MAGKLRAEYIGNVLACGRRLRMGRRVGAVEERGASSPGTAGELVHQTGCQLALSSSLAGLGTVLTIYGRMSATAAEGSK
jgi:hypothetical protein